MIFEVTRRIHNVRTRSDLGGGERMEQSEGDLKSGFSQWVNESK